jgi:8-oxo-dGTP diphosphatase
MTKTIELAGSIIFDEASRVLLLHRRPYADLPARWEIPGGKIKPDEDPETAAVREAHEELGVHVNVVGYMGSTDFRFHDVDYSYEWFQAEVESGTPHVGEPALHDDLGYHALRSFGIGAIGLSPAAEKLAEALQNNEVQVY